MTHKPAQTKLELTWPGKQNRPRLEPRILLEDKVLSYCYPYQKFQSVEGEWRFAQLLEDDPEVIKWMKPAPGQFRIEYRNGRNYEPDFVVETTNACLLVEPKRADQMELDEVQAKARAALRWCGHANDHAAAHGGKRWRYLLVPDTAIQLGRSVKMLSAESAL